MSSYFLTQHNINLLKNTLTQIIGNKIDFEQILMEKINGINSTINTKPPNNIPINNYIMQQNKKVISMVLGDRRLNSNPQHQQHQQHQQNIVYQNQSMNNVGTSQHIFDPSRQMYRETNTNVMERPELQTNLRRNLKLTNRMNQVRDNRDQMFPKQEEIDFSDKMPENEEPADKLYQTMLKKREEVINNSEPHSVPINQVLNMEERVNRQNHIEREQEIENREVLRLQNYYINVDSKDRDLSLYPNPSEFKLEFNKERSNIRVISELKDRQGNIIHQSKRVVDNNDRKNYDIPNKIKEIECKQVIIPPTYNKIPKLNITETNFNEPYLFLRIKELNGPYLSNNNFAKLIPKKNNFGFIEMETNGNHEIYKFEESNNLPNLSLSLVKNNGFNYFNCIDKLFVKNINYDKENELLNIIIQDNHQEYPRKYKKKLNNLNENDLLYFYDKSPLVDNVINFYTTVKVKNIKKCENILFNVYEDRVVSERDNTLDNLFNEKKELICVTMEVLTDSNGDKNVYTDIDFKYVFAKLSSMKMNNYGVNRIIDGKHDFYFYLSYKNDGQVYNEFSKIHGFSKKGVIIEKPDNFIIKKNNRNIYRTGYLECEKGGRQNNDENSLFYKGGHEIVKIDSEDDLIFSIDLGEQGKEFSQNDIFFIQHKLQTNFTFRISG